MAVLEDTAIHIGPRVRALREAMDLSLRDLALRSGVSAPMLSQVERGETSPTLQIASRIAAGLELRLSQLLRLDEAGSREIAVVESGTVVLDIDGERHELATGDCVTFDADLPHHFENPGPGDAALLAVVSAGLRRS